MALPDFIIIGAMKCATSTLHRQLAAQPGIFMSTPKEPNFFSDDEIYGRGLDWYGSLFAGAAAGDLRGEASTHYTKLPTYPDCAERMARAIPSLRLVYMMRDPIDRLISHYMHEWSMGKIACGIDEAIRKFPELIDYGRYGYQLAPYIERFGKDAVLPVLVEDLIADPQAELERVAKFIGYEGRPLWCDDAARQNVSRERIRRFPFYDLLIENPVAAGLRRALVPKALRNTLKSRLQMHERPVLSGAMHEIAQSVFDEDAETLRGLMYS